MSDATFVRSDDDDAGTPPTLAVTFEPPLPFPKNPPIEGFTLCEPTARQMREAEKERNPVAPWAGEMSYMMRLVVLNAGLKPQAGEALGVMVINQCMAFFNEFIDAPPDEDEAVDEGQTPEACTLPIDPPLVWGGQSYGELDLREPLGSEVRNARLLMREPGNLFESRRATMHLVTTVSGLPAPVIEGLKIRILNKAARILGRFTIAGRPTGKT